MKVYLIEHEATFQIGEWRVYFRIGASFGLVEIFGRGPGEDNKHHTLRLQEQVTIGQTQIKLLRVGNSEFRVGFQAPRDVRFYEVPALVAEAPPIPLTKFVVTLPCGSRRDVEALTPKLALEAIEEATGIAICNLNVRLLDDVLDDGPGLMGHNP